MKLTRTVRAEWNGDLPWSPLALPFGWAADRVYGRHAWEVGPAWFIVPRRWYRELEWRFYHYAIQFGLAKEPYEACYWSELIWFPDAPRFQ